MNVLSIDAWAGDDANTWTWNACYTVGHISKEEFEALKTDKDYRLWFKRNGFTTSANVRLSVIEDDQYNIIICDRKDYRPLFAIEYGPEY